MKAALIYTFWQEFEKETDVSKNLRDPIILSIASFRKHHPKMPIYVIDMGNNANWEDWPVILRFKVLKRPWSLIGLSFKKPKGIPVSPKVLSRPDAILWAINWIQEELIIHADSDVIFLKHLFPLHGKPEDINISSNIGLFYFNKNSDQSKLFMELWTSLCVGGLLNPIILENIATEAFPHSPIFHEERVSKYILSKYKNQFSFGKEEDLVYENCLLHYLYALQLDIDKIKTIHLNYAGVNSEIDRNERGKWFLAIKESNTAIKEILGNHISKIFLDPEEYEHKCDSFKNLEYMKKMMGVE